MEKLEENEKTQNYEKYSTDYLYKLLDHFKEKALSTDRNHVEFLKKIFDVALIIYYRNEEEKKRISRWIDLAEAELKAQRGGKQV